MKPIIELTPRSKKAIQERIDRENKARYAAERRFAAESYLRKTEKRKRQIRHSIEIAILLTISLFAGIKAYAGETECLAAIMYGESLNQNFEGVVGLGQAAITRAENQHTTICRERGVKRVNPVKPLDEYFKFLAGYLIKHPSISVSKGADSWNTGNKPSQPGQITRKIDDHTLYILTANGEKR